MIDSLCGNLDILFKSTSYEKYISKLAVENVDYCYCYYWNTIMKKKMLNVYFWNKNEKMSQKDLNSDLKEEPALRSRYWFTLFEVVKYIIILIVQTNIYRKFVALYVFAVGPWKEVR